MRYQLRPGDEKRQNRVEAQFLISSPPLSVSYWFIDLELLYKDPRPSHVPYPFFIFFRERLSLIFVAEHALIAGRKRMVQAE